MIYLSIQCTRIPTYTLYSMYVKHRHTHLQVCAHTWKKNSPTEPAMSAEVLACSSTQGWNTELLSRKGTAQLVGNIFVLFLPDVKQKKKKRCAAVLFFFFYPQLPCRNEAITAMILPDKIPNYNPGALPGFLSFLIKVFFDGGYCTLVKCQHIANCVALFTNIQKKSIFLYFWIIFGRNEVLK